MGCCPSKTGAYSVLSRASPPHHRWANRWWPPGGQKRGPQGTEPKRDYPIIYCFYCELLAGVEGLFGPAGLTPSGPPFGRYPSPANSSSRTNFRSTYCSNRKSLAGVEGFEPPYGGIKTRCLTAWRHPNLKSLNQRGTQPILSRSLIFQARASRSVREPKKHPTPAATYPKSPAQFPPSRGPKKTQAPVPVRRAHPKPDSQSSARATSGYRRRTTPKQSFRPPDARKP